MNQLYPSIEEQKRIWAGGLKEFVDRPISPEYKTDFYGDEWGKVMSPEATNGKGQVLGDYQSIWLYYLKPYVFNKTVIELGCLDGKWIHPMLFHYPKKVIAVDIIEDGFEQIKKWIGYTEHIQFYLTTGDELEGIADQSVDFIFSMDSLVRSEVQIIDKYLAEFKRVLAPGGRACIHLPCQQQPLSHELGFTQIGVPEIEEILLKNGIENCVIDRETINHGVLLLINIKNINDENQSIY